MGRAAGYVNLRMERRPIIITVMVEYSIQLIKTEKEQV